MGTCINETLSQEATPCVCAPLTFVCLLARIASDLTTFVAAKPLGNARVAYFGVYQKLELKMCTTTYGVSAWKLELKVSEL